MKAKAIHQKKLTKAQFFLLMIVPLFIGMFITLSSAGNAIWEEKEQASKSPLKQGWVEFKENTPSTTIL